MPSFSAYDMAIVGASNAGLSAALVLGRARRRVLVLDGGPSRNAPAFHSHSFFTRDGAPPQGLLRIGREQLQPYNVEVVAAEARRVKTTAEGFALTLSKGEVVTAPALLLATGVTDVLPGISGLKELWGRGVYHCPYCHGWETRHSRVAVYGRGEAGYHLAVLLQQWSPTLQLCTDGPAGLTPGQLAHLNSLGVAIREARVKAFDGTAKCLRAIIFSDGSRLPVDAVFMRPAQRQRTDLATQLGCALTSDGVYVQVDETGLTSVPNVYAVGDMTGPLQQVIHAAASGARAAAALNNELILRSCVSAA
ncbi:NAD(P)/FAD-dependent oxidoreductase [Hymenobacter saemangeumensis]|uniref:NAD(P)/FAD-dependent oxidoreductase n=1 Tax=Hymenobacter saemangeumensis TaxID=1084522 RepID=A0ABP8I6K8_9BACT